MTKEEIRQLKKTGKLKELLGDAYDSEASFLRTNTSLSADSRRGDSDSDGGGGKKRKGKGRGSESDGSQRRKSKAETGRAGGKKNSKKGKGGADSDSDSSGEGKGGKDKKKKKGKGGSEGTDEDSRESGSKSKESGEVEREGEGEEGDSDYSYRSEVSEGGTRTKVRVKRIRDKDGNVVGYGAPEPVPDEFRGASVLGREGSVSGASDPGYHDSFKPGPLGLPGEDGQGEGLGDQPPKGREPAWKKERERRRQSKLDALADAQKQMEASKGTDTGPQNILKMDRVPSDFSDESSDSDVDLSAMTEEERAKYLADKEKRRKEREERRRAKYGDRYDEIMKKKKEKKEQERKAAEEKRAQEEQEEKERQERERLEKEKQAAAEKEKEDARRRRSINLKTTQSVLQKKEKPKSMVTYEKAQPRGLGGPIEKTDARDIGPSHTDWTKSERRLSREDSNMSYTKLPPISRSRTFDEDEKKGKTLKRRMPDRGEIIDREKQRIIAEERRRAEKGKVKHTDDGLIEVDEHGRVRLKYGKKIDLSKMSDAMMRRLGIDPNLSNKEKARLLKKLFGDDVTITSKGQTVGFKALHEYDLTEMTDDMLADDPDLDLDTISGQRRVNVLMRRGGLVLRKHMERVMEESHLMDDLAYRNDLDEKGGSVDFMTHYRLVNPDKLENYARAFVVEDQDLDTVITISEVKTAMDGIPSVNTMTSKQLDYVFRVLNITDATQVTFRMFAVITALAERVTSMDSLSKHLLEICNLADIERKLELYMNMFYHNRRGDRDGNFIKADSLQIELIAGGLNWIQQKYIMEKMEVNECREISFLDYMCYIPLFLSMHDNIVDNPLDMSDQKYTMPPRARPPSSQRDMNPLGFPLNKNSSLLMRKQAKDLMEGKLQAASLRPETLDRLYKYAKLPPIRPYRRPSMASSQTSERPKDTDEYWNL